MPSPALIIGVGGTGTMVATYVKKDLLETLQGQWPPKEVRILSFDTDTQQPEIGGQGKLRIAGQSTGAVKLEKGEFFFTGGNVKNLMREVTQGKHPHLENWLLADWYLGVAKPADKIYNLNEGAGQFRQFGRLALFNDVATPAQSKIYNTLRDAMNQIKKANPGLINLQVFVVSSLAGGTGAGMFADIAHLVRKIAEQPDIDLATKMSIRGYLVLPGAFSRTLEPSWLQSMHARAFAAMRENRRFTVNFDYARGYPMHYHAGEGHPIWHGSIKGKLFDLLYYLDGQGENNDLGTVSLRFGIAPAIADSISAAIDAKAGPAFATYVANIDAERVARIARGDLSHKDATFGSVGSYSIVFPIYNIVEAWAHDMGSEVLGSLLMPAEFDERGSYPTKLKTNANPTDPGEDGATAARKFLKANTRIKYSHLVNGKTEEPEVEPTLLPGELGKISEAASNQASNIVQQLINRRIDEWKPSFMPPDTNTEAQKLLNRVNNILGQRIYDPQGKTGQIEASDQLKQKQREDPLLGADRLIAEVKSFKNRILGDEDPRTGQRSGGQYRASLAEIMEFHTTRFNLYLDYYILSTLNGSPNVSATEAKSGKIGFLQDFMASLFNSLERAHTTLQKVQQTRQERGESRRTAIVDAQTASQTMKTMAQKKKGKEAIQAQHSYLGAESALVEILQEEAVEDAILAGTNKMIDYVRKTQVEINAWVEVLGTSPSGLYADLLKGRKQVDSDRAADADIRCRMVVNDKEYEDSRYKDCKDSIQGGWLNKLLNGISWEYLTTTESGKSKRQLQLTILDSNKPVNIAQGDEENNLQKWLDYCRQPFQAARETESVIAYLKQHKEYKDATNLADKIKGHSGVSLDFEGGDPLPANFLRAFFQTEEEKGHREYLRKVIQSLAESSGRSTKAADTTKAGGQTEENNYLRYENSEDRFKFTLVFTQELIELDTITSFSRTGAQAYMGGEDRNTGGDRRVQHIFPAEVHAVEYESRLPELKQQVRIFSDDVALQMEDLGQFKLFLLCYTYKMIKRVGVQIGRAKEQKSVWQLELRPEKETDEFGNKAESLVIWLTDPNKSPLIYDAMTTFNFEGRDIRFKDGIDVLIDYDQVAKTLEIERTKDAQARIKAGTAGQGDPLRQQADNLKDEETRNAVIKGLAWIDRLREQLDYTQKTLIPSFQGLRDNVEQQKDLDVACVFALMLRDEMKNARNTLKNYIPTDGHLDSTGFN